MKRIPVIITMLIFALASLPALPVCAGERQEAGAESDREKDAYEKGMEERLGKLGAKLDQLKNKADEKAGRAEAQMRKRLAEAERQRRIAARKLDELGRASKQTWGKFSEEMERAAKDFERAVERAMRRE